jgi:hypothetical protein
LTVSSSAEFHFFRPQYGDHFPRDLAARHRRGAEAHAAGRPVAEQQVGRAQERGDEARGRARVEVIGLAALEQAALVHDADAVGEREGFLLVMRDQDRRHVQLALDLADGPSQFLADLGVQRAERLVHQQHLRPVRKCPRDGNALLLPARELRGQPVVHALEGDELEQFLAARPALRALHPADAQCELDVLADRHVAEQRVVLEHEPHVALARVHVGHVAAMERHPAMVDFGEAGNGAQQRALAAAARAEQHQELALADVQRNVVDDRGTLVPLGYLIEDDGHAQARKLTGIFMPS